MPYLMKSLQCDRLLFIKGAPVLLVRCLPVRSPPPETKRKVTEPVQPEAGSPGRLWTYGCKGKGVPLAQLSTNDGMEGIYESHISTGTILKFQSSWWPFKIDNQAT